MPRRFRRRTNRRPKQPTFVSNVANIASKAYSTAMAIKKLVNVETKIASVSHDVLPFNDGTPNTTCLMNLQQGDGDTFREGDSIKMKSIYARLMYLPNPGAQNNQIVRTVVWVDKQPNGIYQQFGDVNEDNTTNQVVIGHKDYDKRYTSKILYDKVVSLESDGKPFCSVVNIPVPPKYSHAQFISGTTNIATNKVNVTYVANSPINTCTVSANWRVGFIDN